MTTILNDDGRRIFEIVNFATLCSIFSIFGIAANTVNIIIFYRQGFKNTVNIGFFALAISDMICLITLQWASVCMNPLFAASGIKWYPLDIMYLSAAWPHVCFSRITGFITVYITAERYISIALPLKVKHIITPKKTTIILCLIYIVNLMTLVPEYATTFLGWRFVPSRNKTLIALAFTSSRNRVEGIAFVLHSVLGVLSFVGVVTFTSLLVIKLGQSSQWRQRVASNQNKLADISNRDQKTVKMVIFIATILITCYTPGAVLSLATFIVGPEFNIKGKYTNIFWAMWSTALTFQSINSGANIFLYYSMSSKYRLSFHEIILKRQQISIKDQN